MCATSHCEARQNRFCVFCDRGRSQTGVSPLQHAGPHSVKDTSTARAPAYLTESVVKRLPVKGPTGFPPPASRPSRLTKARRARPVSRLKFESSRVANSFPNAPRNRESLPSKAVRPHGIAVANRESQDETRCRREAASRCTEQTVPAAATVFVNRVRGSPRVLRGAAGPTKSGCRYSAARVIDTGYRPPMTVTTQSADLATFSVLVTGLNATSAHLFVRQPQAA